MARTPSSKRSRRVRSADALLLEATLDSMPYGFSIWDDAERLVRCNRRYLELYNLPAEKVAAGVSLADVCAITVAAGNHPGWTPAELLAEYQLRLRKAAAAPTPLVFEKSIRGRTIKTTYSPTPGLGCIVTHEDVTIEARHQRDLKTQNLRLDAALNNMAHGFCILDRQFRLVLWNQQFATMYGLGEAELAAGASLTGLIMAAIEAGHFPGAVASEMSRRYREALTGLKRDASFVAEETLANGRSIRVTYRRMPDRSFAATHEDVTEEKDRLNALRQRESELAHQNMRFAAAVENMSQGLCMYDRDQKLVICNA